MIWSPTVNLKNKIKKVLSPYRIPNMMFYATGPRYELDQLQEKWTMSHMLYATKARYEMVQLQEKIVNVPNVLCNQAEI